VWTAAQVEALAPDASSLKAGRQLASPTKWSGLGQDPRSLWGLCQGSGKEPYQAQVDLNQPAFRCSCPSRKFPCKHGIGLMLLWAEKPATLPQGQPPGWVTDWLAGRDQRAVKKQEKNDSPPDPEAQARRAAQRQARVDEGVAYLTHWLNDLVRQGLAALPAQPESYWQNASARLIDCQAPGLARQVGRIPYLLSGSEWQTRLLEHLGRLHLLLQAYGRFDQLSPPLQAEVRTRIGWTQNQDELLARPGESDHWSVLGWRALEDEPVSTLRTWLWGEQRRQPALLLDFAAGLRPLPPAPAIGSVWQGEVVYFEGATPLRALPKSKAAAATSRPRPRGHEGLESFLRHWAEQLAANPWLDEYPALLEAVRPGAQPDHLVDSQGLAVPLHSSYGGFWRLAAVSGGEPVTVFGEWNGHVLRPLTLWKGEEAWMN